MNFRRMRFLFFVLLCAFTINGQAQELKKLRNKTPKNKEWEEYYVLKAQPTIKQGVYLKCQGDYLLQRGFYKKNLKDSIWAEYYPGTRQPMAIGKYKSDKKTGVWEEWTTTDNRVYMYQKGMYKEDKKAGPWQFYDKLGDVIKVYDYSSNTLYFEKPAPEEEGTITLTVNGWVGKKLDHKPNPVSPPDENAFFRLLSENLNYPREARSAGYEGLVVVSFVINEDGTESNYQIIKSVERSIDMEAIRVLQLISRKWKPGILDGAPVKTKYLMPIRFSIH